MGFGKRIKRGPVAMFLILAALRPLNDIAQSGD